MNKVTEAFDVYALTKTMHLVEMYLTPVLASSNSGSTTTVAPGVPTTATTPAVAAATISSFVAAPASATSHVFVVVTHLVCWLFLQQRTPALLFNERKVRTLA